VKVEVEGEVSDARRERLRCARNLENSNARNLETLDTHLTTRSQNQGLPIPDLIRQPDIDHRRGKEPYEGADEQQRDYRVGYRIVGLDTEEERAGGRVAPSYLGSLHMYAETES
jgi:hypothetical protein